jgi:hypothetical protein
MKPPTVAYDQALSISQCRPFRACDGTGQSTEGDVASFTRFGQQFDKIEARAMAAVQRAADSSTTCYLNVEETEFIAQIAKKMREALSMRP